MSKAEEAVAEVDAEVLIFDPEHRGLQVWARHPLQQNTLQEITSAISRIERRLGLLFTFKAAAEALIADGHPGLPKREIEPTEIADLQNQLTIEQAAMSMFESNAASGVGLTASPPEPKA